MPSIPQSLLWISLVVLWLFVLVPMLVNKRDTVRRTSDVALATRVVNNGVKSRLIRRSGPAAGHRHDPDWRPVEEFVEDYPDIDDDAVGEVEDFANQRVMIREYDDAVREARVGSRSRSVMVVAAVREQSFVEQDYLDVDVVDENSGALPVGGAGVQGSLFDSLHPDQPPVERDAVRGDVTEADAVAETAEPVEALNVSAQPEIPVDGSEAERNVAADASSAGAKKADEYEYIDDTSGLEAEAEFDDDRVASRGSRSSSSRQRRLSTDTAAAVGARKYRFRKRALMVMAALMMLSAVLSFTVSPALWWSCGAVAAVTVLYLAYLRRQTRIEAQVRRRRQQRMTRVRPVADEASAPRSPEVDFTEFPTRVQRLGAVVLDIDDEDPVFEHLDEVPYSRRHYGRPQAPSRDLPRASGQ
jgi:hypothetical protein